MGQPASSWHRVTDVRADENRGTCSVCGPDVRVKFRKHRNRWACFAIQGKRTAEGHRKSQAAARRANRWRGIPGPMTQERYDAMFAAQGGVCAICGKPSLDKHLAVDHCHATDAIRGLLCTRCNLALGFMDDDPDRLTRAADYLLDRSRTTAAPA